MSTPTLARLATTLLLSASILTPAIAAQVFYRTEGAVFSTPMPDTGATVPGETVAELAVAVVEPSSQPAYGSTWTVSFSATGGKGSAAWQTTYLGARGTGLSIVESAAGTTITGANLPDGTYGPFLVSVADGAKTIESRKVSVVVAAAASPLVVSAPTAGAASLRVADGSAWDVPFTASGGKAPYTFETGTLPTGVSASATSPVLKLVGTGPAGTHAVVATAIDATGRRASVSASVVQDAPLAIAAPASSTLTPSANAEWTVDMAVTGGRPSTTDGYSFSISPALPAVSGTVTTLASNAKGTSFKITGHAQSGVYGGTNGYVVTATDSLGKTVSSAPFKVTVPQQTYSTASWGENFNNVIDPTFANGGYRLAPAGSASASGFEKVVTGRNHACGIRGGKISCWGWNNYGQLGSGNTTDSKTPVEVAGTFDDVFAGYHLTCGTRSGTMYCWGFNDQGQMGDGTQVSKSSPTAIGSYSSIGLGLRVACGLTGSSIKCWGQGFKGTLGDGDLATHTSLAHSTVPGTYDKVFAGGSFNCGMNGSTLKCWGFNDYNSLGNGNQTNSASPVVADGSWDNVSLGGDFGCGIRTGVVTCWGANGGGQKGIGSTTTNTTKTAIAGTWEQVATSEYNGCVRSSTGLVKCWGGNSQGTVGDGTGTDRTSPTTVSGSYAWVAMGGNHVFAAVKP